MPYPKSHLGKLFIKKADLLRELDAVLNAIENGLVTTSGDGSIVNTAGDVRVGVLATDAQHGDRGGSTLHSIATTSVAGFLSAADKTKLDTVVSIANWAVTDWYLDGVAGNDTNDGITAGTPLRTGHELQRRLGPYAWWTHDVTVHVLDSIADGIVLRGYVLSGKHVDVIGTPVALVAGTIGSYAAPVHTGVPTASQVTMAGVVDFTPYVWRRMRLTSGASIDGVAWIACVNPAGVGVATARTSRWSRINPASTTVVVSSVTPVVGTSVVIESLPRVPSIGMYLDGVVSLNGAVNAYPQRQWMVSDVDCPSMMRATTGDVHRFRSILWGSRLQDVTITASFVPLSSFGSCDGCLTAREDISDSGQSRPIGALNYCLIGDGAKYCQLSSPSASMSNCLSQGAIVYVSGVASIVGTQIFDVAATATAAMVVSELGTVLLNSVSGAGNLCPAGIGLNNSSTVTRTGAVAVNVLAAVTPVRLTAAPAVDLAVAQCLPDDWAQKGITPAMIAGTTTVTVPWYDPAIQRVTATHAVFGGTPGVLSVQQISNTQFTITSSSATDISTVNWQISPLGRNIFWSG